MKNILIVSFLLLPFAGCNVTEFRNAPDTALTEQASKGKEGLRKREARTKKSGPVVEKC